MGESEPQREGESDGTGRTDSARRKEPRSASLGRPSQNVVLQSWSLPIQVVLVAPPVVSHCVPPPRRPRRRAQLLLPDRGGCVAGGESVPDLQAVQLRQQRQPD